jgi:uncharacterized membrane protein
MRFLLALLLLAVSGSQALAAIKFCNNFEHQVQFAVAFQDQDGWVSEGWISVPPKACQSDSKHVDLTEFYWRGETERSGHGARSASSASRTAPSRSKIPIRSSRALTSLAL